jgi:protein PhnA
MEQDLRDRSGNSCELCGDKNGLASYVVPPVDIASAENHIFVCETCFEQLENPDKVDPNHWRCLNDSMWSTVPVVKVVAWRMLNQLRGEGWPADLLDMMYMEEGELAWAKEGFVSSDIDGIIHKDSNGVTLQAGDSVTIIKDLDVKGSSITAKRGTAVRNIRLDPDNAEHIEGKVDGQQIVILTKFTKKL